MTFALRAFPAAALLMTAVSPAFVEDDLSTRQYVFDLGAGLMYQPKYTGADGMIASPFPLISIDRLFIPGVGDLIDSDAPPKKFGI